MCIRFLLAPLDNFIAKIYQFSQPQLGVSYLIYCFRHWEIQFLSSWTSITEKRQANLKINQINT